MGARVEAVATPLVRLGTLSPVAPLWIKPELMQPSGSVYDRIAGPLLDRSAELLRDGRPALVAGSGSLCLAFASAAARRGIDLVAVCPEGTLEEHRTLLAQHRCRVITSPAEEGLFGTEPVARRAAAESGGVLLHGPATAADAIDAFAETIGAEISHAWHLFGETPPEVIVAPVGSGALLAGVMRRLAGLAAPPAPYAVVAAAPKTLLDGLSCRGEAKIHAEPIVVDEPAAHGARVATAHAEGILLGLGSAAALHAALQIAAGQPRRILALMIDAGDRYFSRDVALGGRQA